MKWIYDKQKHEFVPADQYQRPAGESAATFLMNDITPFRSPIDGSMITSRSALRNHEKMYGVRQVGNDTARP